MRRSCAVIAAGDLSPLQLRTILSRFDVVMPEDLWSAVFAKLDLDSDGKVSVGEFMKEMKNTVADSEVCA
jgi:Ca2+-binding EF-hand superfamily protein|eukprot:COSAG02_NODE_1798_length_10901_cov_2.933161_7_plen_70_part_00